jgi:hypothetical protein
VTADRGWRRRFDEPIPLPRGRQLVTLRDAGNYINGSKNRMKTIWLEPAGSPRPDAPR